MSIANRESPNCVPYRELSITEQEAIDTLLAINSADGADKEWGNNGDRPDCPAQCRKCGQKRLRWNEDNEHWCRRCRYTFYEEYFGN